MNLHKTEKYILIFLLACLAVAMPILSLNAGISGDEAVHLDQAHDVIHYFSTFGEDKSATHTPVTNLKYYGQSFDNLTTLLGDLFGIKDIYTFRHICNALAGWLCILFAALVAIQLSGNRAAIITVIIMAVSPRFIGHSYNNLKDIPFALGYIASIYYTLKVINNIRHIQFRHAAELALSMAFILSIRPGGLLVFCYFLMFGGISLLLFITKKTFDKKAFFSTIQNIALITIAAYFIGLLFWPYALENPLLNPLKSIRIMSNYPVILRQLFEGKMYWSDQLPWYYLLKYVVITIPIIVLPLVVAYLLTPIQPMDNSTKSELKKISIIAKGFVIFTVVFPFIYTIIAQSNVYGAWRHLLFIYPSLVVIAAIGLNNILSLVKFKSIKYGIATVFALSLLAPISFIYKNHPVEYTYFNKLAGDYKKVAEEYELDYYYHSVGDASKWLKQFIEEQNLEDVKIASNYGVDHYLRDCSGDVSFSYTPYYARGNVDWDYGIFYRTTISPSQTRQNVWPPIGTIKSIEVENVPVCVIVKRQTHDDYLGKIAYENMDYERAESLLLRASKVDPGNEIAWINLGKTYLKQSEYATVKEARASGDKQSKYALAKAAFEQCLNIIPNYEPALFYLAEIEILFDNPGKAEEHYQKILEVNTKSFKTYLAYAQLEEKLLKYANAITLLDKCLHCNPHNKKAKALKEQIAQKIKNNI